MTAEQLELLILDDINYQREHHKDKAWLVLQMVKWADAYAAAQLAEKEREIARVTQSNVLLQEAFAERTQRLQEAQTENQSLRTMRDNELFDAQQQVLALRATIDEDGKQFTAINQEMLDLRERLRERESELEHAMDKSVERCNAAIPSPPKEAK